MKVELIHTLLLVSLSLSIAQPSLRPQVTVAAQSEDLTLEEAHLLNITIAYTKIDIKEGQLILSLSGIGYGFVNETVQSGQTLGIFSSEGADISGFNITWGLKSPAHPDKTYFAAFNLRATLSINSNMMLYPSDNHRIHIELFLIDIAFKNLKLDTKSSLGDFDYYTEAKLFAQGNSSKILLDCLFQRSIWGTGYLMIPLVSFYIVLVLIPFIKSEDGDWFSKRLLAILSLLTFTSVNLWGIYGTIRHSTQSPSVLEFDLYLLLVSCVLCLLFSFYESKTKQFKKHDYLYFATFALLLVYWIGFCFISPAPMFVDMPFWSKWSLFFLLLLPLFPLIVFPCIFVKRFREMC